MPEPSPVSLLLVAYLSLVSLCARYEYTDNGGRGLLLCPAVGINECVSVQIHATARCMGIIVYFASTFAGHYVKMSDATPPERREDALGTL